MKDSATLIRVLVFATLALSVGGLGVASAQAQSSGTSLGWSTNDALPGIRDGAASFADFDDDGNLDLLVAGDSTGGDAETASTTLLMGNGDGTFTPTSTSLPAVVQSVMAVADVNGDDDEDVVLGGANTDPVVYLGNGDGTFDSANAGFDPITPSSVSVADVDGDENMDVLFTGETGSGQDLTATTVLYFGNGDGTFEKTSTPNVTDVYQSSTSIGDVDGDGNADLLVTGNTSIAGVDPVGTLYLGDGDGTFSASNADLTAARFSSTAIADIDGDGNQDLFITGSQFNDVGGTTVYYGDGDGAFTVSSKSHESGSSGDDLSGVVNGTVAIGDFSDDENKDILISGEPDGGESVKTTLFLGNGDRTFNKANAQLLDVGFSAVAVGDLYNDDDTDVALFGDSTPGLADQLEAALYVNSENQSPPNRAPVLVEGIEADTVAAGRVLRDTIVTRDADGGGLTVQSMSGRPGLSFSSVSGTAVAVSYAPSRVSAGQDVSLTLQVDDGSGSPLSTSADVHVSGLFARRSNAGLADLSVVLGDLSTADVNGDGREDLFVSAEPALFFGQRDGTFSRASNDFGFAENPASAFGDVNGDGNTDLVFARETFDGRMTTVYLGNGDGTFTEAEDADLVGTTSGTVSTPDVDDDGNDDILITGESGSDDAPTTELYLSDGDGTFSPAGANLDGFKEGTAAAGDVDDDGNTDLLLTGVTSASSEVTRLYLGNGDGTFQEQTPSAFTDRDFEAFSTAITDLDGDGIDDVLIANVVEVKLYSSNGDGTFSSVNTGIDDFGEEAGVVADFDGDDNKDLLTAGSPTVLYLGDGTGRFSPAGANIEGNVFEAAGGDFHGDGDLDLAFPDAETAYQNLGQELTPSTTVSESVSGDGTVDFGETGADVSFTGVSESGDVTVERFDSGPFDPDSIEESNVSQYRLTIEAASGLSFTSAQVQLAVSAFSGIEDPTNVTVYRRPTDGRSAFQEIQTTVGTNGTSEVSDDTLYATTSTFSEFVLASDTEPLPVEMAGIEATLEDDAVRLAWQTASETGNAGFRVQRRSGGEASAWTTVGTVDGAGTTSQAQRYRFRDTGLPYAADRLTYRLKQVDTDGSTSYSETVTVERRVDEVQLLGTAPNPAREQATIRYALPEKQEVTVRLYDVLGRQVRTVVNTAKEGRHEQTLDVSGLSSGVYFLRLRSAGTIKTQKLTVVR